MNNNTPMFTQVNALFGLLSEEIHKNAVEHGWWDEPREDGTCIALMHSELSEALEALRHGNQLSDHIGDEGYSGLEEELADVIIRIFDFAAHKNINVGGALVAKHEFNKKRPYRHGGKAF